MRYRFPHDRLVVWHVACDARTVALHFTETLPRGFGHETRQIRDASASVVRNICEGASRFKPAEKVQKYEIAAGEAGEAAGAIQSLLKAEIGDAELGRRFLELEGRAGAMLTALIRRHRGR